MTIKPSQVMETVGRNMLADGFPVIFDSAKSRGCRVSDATTGREYLDLFSCFASIPVGYNHPKMLEPEFLEKLGRVAVNKITLSAPGEKFADCGICVICLTWHTSFNYDIEK